MPRVSGGGGAPRHILMTTDAVGGVWTYALDLAAGLAGHGVRTTLAVLGPGPSREQRRAADGVTGLTLIDTGLPVEWLAEGSEIVESAGVRLAALAAELRPDLIHLNSPALAAVARFPAPVVAAAHSCVKTWWRAVEGARPLPADLCWRAALTGRGYAAADAVIAPTCAFARATADAYDLFLPEVVLNGRYAFGATADGPPGAFAFTAGRLWDRGKGLATLDRAAALGALTIVCAGPTEAPHGERLSAPNLRLLGPLAPDAVRAWLAQRPVFVSAAVYEPFGLAVLEAAQAGCALVLSDIPSLRELWEGAAVFVPPHDAAGFAEAVGGLLADPVRRGALATEASRRAAAFDVAAMTQGTLAVYERLFARPAEVAA